MEHVHVTCMCLCRPNICLVSQRFRSTPPPVGIFTPALTSCFLSVYFFKSQHIQVYIRVYIFTIYIHKSTHKSNKAAGFICDGLFQFLLCVQASCMMFRGACKTFTQKSPSSEKQTQILRQKAKKNPNVLGNNMKFRRR